MVIDLRGSARYIAAGVTIVGGIALAYVPNTPETIVLVGLEAANIAFGFLFGQRVLANFRK